MNIIGIGTTIVECARIGRMIQGHGELFLARVYTPQEIRACRDRLHVTECFAELWAAKEAVRKCLAVSWRRGASWTEVEVTLGATAAHVELHGALRERAADLGLGRVWLSVAHCRAYATAHAVAVSRG